MSFLGAGNGAIKHQSATKLTGTDCAKTGKSRAALHQVLCVCPNWGFGPDSAAFPSLESEGGNHRTYPRGHWDAGV